MSITTKYVVGIAAALIAFGPACTDSKEQGQNETTQTTKQAPTTAVTKSELPPLAPVSDVSESELAQFFSSMPDGRGLPEGSGTVAQGKEVYTKSCAACHGAMLEGGSIGDKLIGGRGTLVAGTEPPVKTIESYWPYATTLWDYIKRAMPFSTPGSLSNDDVYAVTAYILNQAKIVPDDATLSKETLPKVEMPNRNGFRAAGR
ncbi:MAG: c-type cytochrome [Acidimicrobiia bacterium]